MSSLRNSIKKAALHHSHSRENGNPVFAPLIPTGNNDRVALEQTYRFYVESMAEIPRTEPNGWRNLISTFGKNEKEMARLLDMSLLDELQREGFFDRIGR